MMLIPIPRIPLATMMTKEITMMMMIENEKKKITIIIHITISMTMLMLMFMLMTIMRILNHRLWLMTIMIIMT